MQARRAAGTTTRGAANAGPSDLGSRVLRVRTEVGREDKRASPSSAKCR